MVGNVSDGRSSPVTSMWFRILTRLTFKVFRYLSHYRGLSATDNLASLISIAHYSIDNAIYDIKKNGEMRVLEVVARHGVHTVFDVGANVGEWSIEAHRLFPAATIHAFELVPNTYQHLVHNTQALERLRPNDYGLASTPGIITINLSTTSGMSSAHPLKGTNAHDALFQNSMECVVDMGENYLQKKGIDHVDFLKTDTEGMDYSVIMGFGSRIDDIDIIQFEYNSFNIASHHLLYDFYRYLKKYNFTIGKIFPRNVVFFEYSEDMENFHGSNFIAVKNHLTDLIDDLTDRKKRAPIKL